MVRRSTSRLFNLKSIKSSFWPPSGHFFQILISEIDFSDKNTLGTQVSACYSNEFLFLKIASSFQAASNQLATPSDGN